MNRYDLDRLRCAAVARAATSPGSGAAASRELVLAGVDVDRLERLMNMMGNAEDLGPFAALTALRPLIDVPPAMQEVRSRLRETGRRQLEAAKARGEATVTLRLPLDDDVVELARWLLPRVRLAQDVIGANVLPKHLEELIRFHGELYAAALEQISQVAR